MTCDEPQNIIIVCVTHEEKEFLVSNFIQGVIDKNTKF